jgi:hypothetical protein
MVATRRSQITVEKNMAARKRKGILESFMYQPLAYVIKKSVSLSYKLNGSGSLHEALLERGLVIHFKDYYGPFVSAADIRFPLDGVRNLPGLKFDFTTQEQFLKNLCFVDELLAFPDDDQGQLQYAYRNAMFGAGDAEILYGMIRFLKPKRVVEVGAGNSTLIAQEAVTRNRKEDAKYSCSHICIEPYENAWLERLDAQIIRKKVEEIPVSFFADLEANDILFIDSSHAVRPQGDVNYEIFDVYGSLKPEVYVHVHDIFTPRDYPHEWVIKDRKLWQEQYLLEAFLSFNKEFQVVCALNWLWKDHPEALKRACPVLTSRVPNEPRSFWFKRIQSA